MFGLFKKPKSLLNADEWEWHLACLKWLQQEFPDIGGKRALQVHPDGNHFSIPRSSNNEVAESLLDQTKSLIGMKDWPSYLVVGANSRAPMMQGTMIEQFHTHAPGGTFRLMIDSQNDIIAEITYNPAEAERHEKLAAIFAHEMSHFLLETRTTIVPGGEDCLELMTDFTAIWLGFGILMANSAKSVDTFQTEQGHGWQTHLSGYLSEAAIITAFACIERMAGRDSENALPYLKPHLAVALKTTNKFLDSIDLNAEIDAINLEEFQVSERRQIVERYPINPPAPLTL